MREQGRETVTGKVRGLLHFGADPNLPESDGDGMTPSGGRSPVGTVTLLVCWRRRVRNWISKFDVEKRWTAPLTG